jgi:two-component system phosphate regulon sensor histidine kinase PhoR
LEERPYVIKAEVSHLENAINNLLDNAKKYASDPKVELTSFIEKRKLVISIKDNGKGIGKRDKKLVFQKYYRVSNGNKHGVKGYGLGLSYVRKVIEKHKGTIILQSEVEQGTTVILKIPLYKNGKEI